MENLDTISRFSPAVHLEPLSPNHPASNMNTTNPEYILVLVGPVPVSFVLERDLLKSHSGFFRDACLWQDGTKCGNPIRLVHEHPHDFSLWIDFLIKGEYPFFPSRAAFKIGSAYIRDQYSDEDDEESKRATMKPRIYFYDALQYRLLYLYMFAICMDCKSFQDAIEQRFLAQVKEDNNYARGLVREVYSQQIVRGCDAPRLIEILIHCAQYFGSFRPEEELMEGINSWPQEFVKAYLLDITKAKPLSPPWEISSSPQSASEF